MAKDLDLKAKFVELRSKGLSYDKISKELGVSKRSLIEWSRELQYEIANLRAVELEAILDKHLLAREQKLEMYRELLEKVRKNFLERDLSDLDTEKLFNLFLRLIGLLESEVIFKEKFTLSGLDFVRDEEKVRAWQG